MDIRQSTTNDIKCEFINHSSFPNYAASIARCFTENLSTNTVNSYIIKSNFTQARRIMKRHEISSPKGFALYANYAGVLITVVAELSGYNGVVIVTDLELSRSRSLRREIRLKPHSFRYSNRLQ